MNPYAWTSDDCQRAAAILRRFERGHLEDALPSIEQMLRKPASSRTLRSAFERHGMGPPSSYLRSAFGDADALDAVAPPDTPRAPPVVVVDDEPKPNADRLSQGDRFDDLMAAVRKGPATIEDLCNRLDLSPNRLRALVSQAYTAGLSVEIHGDHIGRRPPVESMHDDERPVRMPAPVKGRNMYAVASDIHIGNKHHLKDELEDFVERAYARGVRTVLCPGDLLDGVYRHSVWEQSHRGFDEQVREAARSLPKRPGMSWHFILGNHDQTFEDSCGLDVGRAIADTFRSEGRTDWTYHGSRGAYLRLASPGERGIVVEMWHPAKGGAYALSYKMQNHIRDYAVGAKPDCLLVGHWHQQCYFVSRGVHAMSCGTWQGGRSAYGRSLGGSPSIGGWVVEYATTADGTVREFCPTWNAYYETETARDVMMSVPAFGEERSA